MHFVTTTPNFARIAYYRIQWENVPGVFNISDCNSTVLVLIKDGLKRTLVNLSECLDAYKSAFLAIPDYVIDNLFRTLLKEIFAE